jgi:hypothetical protein
MQVIGYIGERLHVARIAFSNVLSSAVDCIICKFGLLVWVKNVVGRADSAVGFARVTSEQLSGSPILCID